MKSFRKAIVAVLLLFVCVLGIQGAAGCASGRYAGAAVEANITECTPFSSFQEIEQYIDDFNSYYPSSGCGFLFGCGAAGNDQEDPSVPSEPAGDTLANGDSLTNTQVENVDEADIIKVNNNRIFTANTTYSGGISVINARNDSVFRIPCYDYAPEEFYVDGTRLLVIGKTRKSAENDYPVGYSTPEDLKAQGNTVFMIYDIEALDPECDFGALIYTEQMLVRRMTVNSYGLSTTRKVGSHVYGVFVSPALRRANTTLMPEFYDSVARSTVSVPANRIYKAPHNRSSLYMVLLVGFDLNDTRAVMNASSYLTSGSVFYSSENSFYTSFDYYENSAIRTNAMRFEIADGTFRFFGTAQMDGYLKDQFCMDEYENTFRAVATSASSRTGADASRLYVFDCSESGLTANSVMREIGRSADMGKNEQLYSVRFNKTSCVVTTAVTVDPLYYIDLSDPTSPAITSELKSEGANTYLHPLNEENSLILGIGHGEGIEGLKLSVYYRDERDQLKELLTYQNPDIRYNDVLENHKALLVYGDLFAFPVHYKRSVYTAGGYQNFEYNGLLTFRISGDLSDYDLQSDSIGSLDYRLLSYREGDYNRVNDTPKRGVVANYKLYMVGNEAAFSFDLSDLSPISALGLTRSYSPPSDALSTQIGEISVHAPDRDFDADLTLEELAASLTVHAVYEDGKNAVSLPADVSMLENFSLEEGIHVGTVSYAGRSVEVEYRIVRTVPVRRVQAIEVYPAEITFSIHTTAEQAAAALTMTVLYSDGTKEDGVRVSASNLTNFRSDKAAVYNGAVRYQGVTGYFEYKIVDDRTLETVMLMPDSVTVQQGDSLAVLLERFYLLEVYSDRTTANVTPTAQMVTGFSSESTGSFTATVSYRDRQLTLAYTVTERTSDPAVEIMVVGQTNFARGTTLEQFCQAITLTVELESGTILEEVEVTPDMVAGFGSEECRIYTVTISCRGGLKQFQYTVTE